jgi:hypothetical protein
MTNLFSNEWNRGTLHHSNNGFALCSLKIKLANKSLATLDSDNNATYIFGANANHAVCKKCAKKLALTVK